MLTTITLNARRQQAIVMKLPDGRQVTLSIADVRGDKVRLGIEADRSIQVDRSEVRDANMRGEVGW